MTGLPGSTAANLWLTAKDARCRALHTIDIFVELGVRELYRSAYLPPSVPFTEALEERNLLYEYFNKPYPVPIVTDNGREIGRITARTIRRCWACSVFT
ncbi:hypothetical protein [Saccharibacillus deserti]|uniref:hypothetical protein n=1 Tax=Saccharibacillus deserti TaxID=1634444 RepID=UPI0015533EE8|nr:hypothetical protein [Saccharibacillus deserti]